MFSAKWVITGVLAVALALVISRFAATRSGRGELVEWVDATWMFAKQILPLLLFGILVAGVLLGRPGGEGIIPSSWVSRAVGGNSLAANLFASIAGAFMYFATLTEVPILQGLIGSGMGKGPALALLLAGPALSLPSMLVLSSIMGTRKTVVYCSLVVVMATMTGMIYGSLVVVGGDKMKIQILGTGCPKCKKLAENAEAAAKELGLEHEIEKVTDINEIMKFGIMTTPGLAVDGKVKVAGKVPSVEEIKKLLG